MIIQDSYNLDVKHMGENMRTQHLIKIRPNWIIPDLNWWALLER